MFKNYFITSIRALRRNPQSSAINIIGLAISLSASLYLFMVLKYEFSFDSFYHNPQSIYRVVMEYDYPEGIKYTAGVPAPMPEALRNDFAQLEKVGTMISTTNVQINVLKNDQVDHSYKIENGVFFSEPEMLEILDFPWLYGSPRSALSEPNLVVLTQQMAENFFGSWQNAIGKSIQWKFIQYGELYTLKINGILKNLPDNTDIPLKIVVSFKTRPLADFNWRNVNASRQCFIRLPEGMSSKQISGLLPAFEKKHMNSDEQPAHFILQPVSDMHFDSRFGNFNKRTIGKSTLLSLAIIGIFLLVTAAINFINLAIAQVIRKSKEVGIRKTLGSTRHQLVIQFFMETFVIVVLSSILALMLAQLAAPTLKPVLNLPENFTLFTPTLFTFLLALIFILTLLSGLYPAGVMTRFQAAIALKSSINNQTVGGVSLRKGLVVIQFIIAQLLVISTLVVLFQVSLFQNTPLGFDQHALISFAIPMEGSSTQKIEPLRHTLSQQAGISHVSFHSTPPSWRTAVTSNFRFDRSIKEAPFEVVQKFGDPSYFQTFGVELVAGRVYQQSDTAREFVVNEAFVRKIGLSNNNDILGKTITMSGSSYPLPIVGVMKDFNARSLRTEIEPIVITADKYSYTKGCIKIDLRKSEEIIKQLNTIFTSHFPGVVFQYEFVDEVIANNYKEETRLALLIKIFAGLAIFISCLGLYGLVSFMTIQRTKEVGIRKVLGASISDILFLFTKEFVLLVILAFIIAAPIAWYYMQQWLAQFALHIDLGPAIFIISIASTLLLALITISTQSIKAAMANPVDALKNE
jgi:ABC-type antimicrobial peptide transport system permease subunit